MITFFILSYYCILSKRSVCMTCYICWLVIHFKGSSQFLFLLISFTPKKSGASQVCITFLQVTQKILTEDTFHWSLKFWNHWKHFYKFSAWENSHSVFVILPKICQKIEKKNYIPGILWVLKSKLQIIHPAHYIALFLPDTNNYFV